MTSAGDAGVRVTLLDLGLVDYGEALALQRELFEGMVAREGDEGSAGWLILCEHPHVYTLGKSGRAENLLVSEEFLRERGAALHKVERGGDITYHGPGQLVGYPILDLEKLGMGLREYIEALEQSVIESVGEFGICAGRSEGKTGVWVRDGAATASDGVVQGDAVAVNERKICAIGVRSSRWVTMHGFALNVTTDLSWFGLINPCGFAGGTVTSIEKEIEMRPGGREQVAQALSPRGSKGGIGMEEVKRVLCGRLEANLGLEIM